jgi:hypothetical protein
MEKRHRRSVCVKMSKELRSQWLPKLQARYAGRGREGKGRMLDELCEDHGYERKYAIKLLSEPCLPVGGFGQGRSGATSWLNRWCARYG